MSYGYHERDALAFDGMGKAYRRLLLAVLVLNGLLFVIEGMAGVLAGSMALKVDSLDFLADAVVYGVALFALGRPMVVRAQAAVLQGLGLGLAGVLVAVATAVRALDPGPVDAMTMGAIGSFALAVNVSAAVALMAWRDGDATMRSVWDCSRHDLVGNLSVIVAGALVALSGSVWPDLVIAAGLSAVFLHAAWRSIRRAVAELRTARARDEAAGLAPEGHPAEVGTVFEG